MSALRGIFIRHQNCYVNCLCMPKIESASGVPFPPITPKLMTKHTYKVRDRNTGCLFGSGRNREIRKGYVWILRIFNSPTLKSDFNHSSHVLHETEMIHSFETGSHQYADNNQLYISRPLNAPFIYSFKTFFYAAFPSSWGL